MTISRLISSYFRGPHTAIRHAASSINAEARSIGPSWSSSSEEMRLTANSIGIAPNIAFRPNLQHGNSLASQNDSRQHKISETLYQPGLFVARSSSGQPLVDLSAALGLLSVEDRAVRLPSYEWRAPMTTPTSAMITPQQLPHTPGSASTIVEPYENCLPKLLPTAHEGAVFECINMVRLRQKKMKKHKRKKEYKRNRVSHEHRILMDIIRKEKLFMLEQTTLLDEAEQFSAEQYVTDKIKTYRRPIPKFWKGKRLPESVVIGLMRRDGLTIQGIDD
ncbi:hypothetical protein FHG87_017954 [Trinorchestia longiramus]|nr:hypothetical protein FHG87_017954 [Trinorchestia longiramus]